MIGIYDKGRLNTRFIRNVENYAKEKIKVCGELQNLLDCKIAIAHIFDEDWDTLIDEYSYPNSVRVRVSTAGFRDASSPTITGDDVCVFYLVPSSRRLSSRMAGDTPQPL